MPNLEQSLQMTLINRHKRRQNFAHERRLMQGVPLKSRDFLLASLDAPTLQNIDFATLSGPV